LVSVYFDGGDRKNLSEELTTVANLPQDRQVEAVLTRLMRIGGSLSITQSNSWQYVESLLSQYLARPTRRTPTVDLHCRAIYATALLDEGKYVEADSVVGALLASEMSLSTDGRDVSLIAEVRSRINLYLSRGEKK
jgi:hypothetical protein